MKEPPNVRHRIDVADTREHDGPDRNDFIVEEENKEAVMEWQQSVEVPDPQYMQNWVRSVPTRLRPIALLWVAEVSRHRKAGLSGKAVSLVRQRARDDIDETIEFLDRCSPDVLATWIGWYPVWVRSLTAELHAENPWLWLPAEVVYANAKAGRDLANVTTKQERQFAKVGAELYWLMTGQEDGRLRWNTTTLGKKLKTRAGPIAKERLWEMAKALVWLDLASFQVTGARQRWLVRTD